MMIATHRGTETAKPQKWFLCASVPRCVAFWNRISKPQSHARLHAPHLARRTRQAELRTADQGVDDRVRHTVEDVGGVDAPVQIQPAAPRERSRDARVQPELRGAPCGVASCISPFA